MSTRREAGKPPGLSFAEACRQLVHIVSGLWAFVLPWSGWQPLVALTAAATIFNLWLLPRIGGRWLWRPQEQVTGRAPGMVLYPLIVTLLLLVFRHRLEVAAAGWGLLAFADGTATLVGRAAGRRPLPWNPGKSWEGLAAYLVTGWLAVWGLVSWVTPGRYDSAFLVLVGAATATVGALLESAPQRLDDNLTVPPIASLLLFCLLESANGWDVLLDPALIRQLLLGLTVNTALAIVAFAANTLDAGGAVVGALLGTVVFAFLDWGGFLVLATFIVVSSGATRLGWTHKSRSGLVEPQGGRRRIANAIANGGVATLCALFAGVTPHRGVFALAFVCSLAAATADTLESEIGSVWGRPTVLITDLRPVEAGTDGGVSLIGSLAGLAGAGMVVLVAWVGGLLAGPPLVSLAVLGWSVTFVESVVGATLERAGWIDNHAVNLLNTLLAALAGALLATAVA